MSDVPGAEPPVEVSLSANGGRTVTLNKDLPLVLFVSMINYEATDAALKNQSLRMRIETIKKEAKENDTDREELKKELERQSSGVMPVRTYRFGGRETWTSFVKFEVKQGDGWVPTEWPIHLVSRFPDSSVAVLDAEQTCSAEFGIDPMDVEKITKGRYEMRAYLELLRDVHTVSNSVVIDFTGSESSQETRAGEGFLYALATYYAKRGPSERAKSYLREALAVHPGYSRLAVIMGDTLEREGDFQGALDLYEKALEDYSGRSHGRTEVPEALIVRIRRLRSRLLAES